VALEGYLAGDGGAGRGEPGHRLEQRVDRVSKGRLGAVARDDVGDGADEGDGAPRQRHEQERLADAQLRVVVESLQRDADGDRDGDRREEGADALAVDDAHHERNQHRDGEILDDRPGEGDALSPVDADRHHWTPCIGVPSRRNCEKLPALIRVVTGVVTAGCWPRRRTPRRRTRRRGHPPLSRCPRGGLSVRRSG